MEIPLTPLNIKGKVPKSCHETKLANIVLTVVSNFLKAALRDTGNIPQSVNPGAADKIHLRGLQSAHKSVQM